MSDVGASLRRHWRVVIVVLSLIPLVMAVYFVNRDVVRPAARYSTSADVLIPARDLETPDTTVPVPPVLLQGQIELALSRPTMDVVLLAADLDPEVDHDLGFDAKLSKSADIITLTVSAPEPELAASVLDEYIIAYQEGRRQSVLDAAIEQQSIQERVVGVLTRELGEVEGELDALGLPLPLTVPDGEPVVPPPGASNSAILLYYERNAILNETTRRLVDYSLQATRTAIPGDFSVMVQRRSAARITPPPPSPLIPLLEILGIGLVLAMALPVLLDWFDATITEARAAPGALRARLLVTIPFMPRRLHDEFVPPGSTWDAAFRSLAATSISTDRLPKAIMVTCPVGSTQDSVAANFAAALASLGVTVALVGTVPRQGWFLDEVDGGDADGDVDVYVDVDVDEQDSPTGDDDSRAPSGIPSGPAAPAPEPPAVDEAGATEEILTRTAPVATEPTEGLPEASLDAVPTFPELLEDAQAGRLTGDIRARLATRGAANFYVVPPGDDEVELSLDGLPTLLDALATNEIDITVIAGPALLEDPNATIIAWSTRHVLWALEIGRVNTRDAQLAADRLELAGVAPFGIALVNRHALRS